MAAATRRGKRGGRARPRGSKKATRKTIYRARMGEAGRAINAYRKIEDKSPADRRAASGARMSYYSARQEVLATGSKRAARAARKGERQSVRLRDTLAGTRSRSVIDRRVKGGMSWLG